ncbi:MAG: MotA/TolQ/ExbB proton channel family protein [Clostridiales bacterium]|nr:MotA/TolQ/ExbB proton channel family protein [Clostridiales bacterium]
MSIIGSEYIVILLHALAQSLLIPVLLGLLAMTLYIVVELGNFIAERQSRKRKPSSKLMELFYDVGKNPLWQDNNLRQAVENSSLSSRQKNLIYEFVAKKNLGKKQRKILARDLLDQEEHYYEKILSKTDLVCKLGPVLGLMGTLIPLGPGLTALGKGDIQGLSEAVIIAFDTTVMGICVGAISSVISKVRRGWYQKDLNYMENILELIEGRGKLTGEEQEKKKISG